MNGGAWGMRNRGGEAVNPDCDYCDNCGQHGHEAEDCCNPPLPDSPYRNGPKPEPIKFWTAVWCLLSLNHFGGGVAQDAEGNYRCKRCHRKMALL